MKNLSYCENIKKKSMGGGGEGGEVRLWGQGGCVQKIEVIVKMQKKSRGRGGSGWGGGGGMGGKN